jgi:hypothetical protein
MKSTFEIFRKAIFALLILSVSVSCEKDKKQIDPKEEPEVKASGDPAVQNTPAADGKSSSEFAFLDSIRIKNIPLEETTNFDTYSMENKLTASQIKLLSLDKIINNKEVINIYLNYKLNISPAYKSIVISYEIGDAELVTTLINYNEEYAIAGSQNIAYDEIAESMFNIESEIKGNTITCIETDFSNEEPEETAVKYTIMKNGKIVKTDQSKF